VKQLHVCDKGKTAFNLPVYDAKNPLLQVVNTAAPTALRLPLGRVLQS